MGILGGDFMNKFSLENQENLGRRKLGMCGQCHFTIKANMAQLF